MTGLTARRVKLDGADALVSLDRALQLAPTDGLLRLDILFATVCASECIADPDAHPAALDRGLVEMPTNCPLLALRADRRRRRGDLAVAPSDVAKLKDLGIDLEG